MNLCLQYTDEPTREDLKDKCSSRYLDRGMSCRVVENGVIIPNTTVKAYSQFIGEIVKENGDIIENVNPNVIYSDVHKKNVHIEGSLLPYETTPVVYLGTIINCWGHFFTDGLSKMWYFFSDVYKEMSELPLRFLFVSPYSNIKQCPKPLSELVNLLGLDIELLPITELKRYKRIYVPDNSLFIQDRHRVYTKEFKETINAVIESANNRCAIKGFDKIYLSRTHWIDKNADFGERPIEKLFKRLGYKIIYPEKYSVTAQIVLYQKAKSIVTTSGSIAHNAIFARSNTTLVVLRKCYASQDYQQVCNELQQLNVYYVDAHLSMFVAAGNPNLGPFFLYINDNLRRFIADKENKNIKTNFDTKLFMNYARLCMKRENVKMRLQNNDIPDYYYTKLSQELTNQTPLSRKVYELFHSILGQNNIILSSIKKIYCKFNR